MLHEETKEKYSVIHLPDAVKSKTSKYKPQILQDDDIIVNLNLIENIDKSFYLENCDRDAHLKQLQNQKEELDIFDVIKEEDKYVVMNGIPGVGKTTLINSLLYKWSCGEIWNGKNGSPKFDFVFVLYCRKLNKYMKCQDIHAEKMLLDQYTAIFSIIDINLLRSVKENVLLIIEGFDEFGYLSEFTDTNQESFYGQSMYDILNPENSEFPFCRLITGRPLACSYLTDTFCDQVKLKHLEVTGFTDKNIRKYISNFCMGDENLARSIEKKIDGEEVIKGMTSIPVFAWAVCCIVSDDTNIEAPKTNTAIYAYLLLVFLRNHGQCGAKKKLIDILKDGSTKKCLEVLSKMAFISLTNGKIIFKEEGFNDWDIDNVENVFEISGLITKIEGGDFDEASYQFTHLSLHEFLAAIHIYYHYEKPIDFVELLKDEKLRDVVPFLAGLEGGKLKNSNSDKVVQLYSLLWIRGKSTIDFKSILQYDMRINMSMDCSVSQLMFEYQNELLEFCADKDVVKLDFSRDRMTPYQVSATVFMLKNLLSWSNWLFSEICVNSGDYDERLLQVLPSCMKRCDSVLIDFYGDEWSHELLKVVPFLKKVAVQVSYYIFENAVGYIGNAISNTSECILQHMSCYVYLPLAAIHDEFPKDVLNDILKFSHLLETVTVSFPLVLPHDIKQKWINPSHVMKNDVNKRISDGLMGKLQHFVINLPVTNVVI